MSTPDEQAEERAADEASVSLPGSPRPMGKDDYLVPGPTAESNEGLVRWGLSWLIFSILLMLLMLGITVACFFIGSWLNLG